MNERKGVVTFKGKPVTLVGKELKVGEIAPDFRLTDNSMSPVTLATYAGKTRIISAVPSIDTPVCDTETRRFNQEASQLSDDTVILTVSMDLPFAQKRWCGAAGIDRVITLSDYRDSSFGVSYGVLMEELRLLARAVFVVGPDDVIRYIQFVPEVTSEPDYDAVFKAVKYT